jgi:hypothetical protein
VTRPAAWLIAILAIAPFLAGCATTQRAEMQNRAALAKAEFAAEKAKCAELWPPSQGNYLPRAKCESIAFDRIGKPLVPNPDLFELAWSYRIALADRVDRGELSPEDGRLRMAQVNAQLSTEARNRLNAARRADAPIQMAEAQERAQQIAAMGNLLTGLAALQQTDSPPSPRMHSDK